VRDAVGLSGTVLVALILGAPAGLSTLLGGAGSADPVNTFIAVLLFTLPLSLGIVIFFVGGSLMDLSDQAVMFWALAVAVGALVLSTVAGGAVVTVPDFGPDHPWFIPVRILAGFFNAYSPVGFIGAIIAGGTLVYLYFDIVYRRLFPDR
jgi:hypothetical protein